MYPYHVYMDLDVINNDYTSTTAPQLRFEETRNQPFLDGDSSDYFCSIVRFSIQTGNTLPVFIPRIRTGQFQANKTVYRITLKDTIGGRIYYGAADVMYIPEDKTAPTPLSPLVEQDVSSSYYYVYNFQHFVDLLNTALAQAWSYLAAAIFNGEGAVFWKETVPPFFDIDSGKMTVVLNADKEIFDSSLTSPVELFLNARLFELLVGLPHEYQSKTGDMNYKIKITNRSNANVSVRTVYYTNAAGLVVPEPVDMVQMEQEISSMALWSPVASIVFASTMLPVLPTQTSPPKNLGTNSNFLTGGGNNSNLTNILSDFSIAIDTNNQYRPAVEYNPGAEYRLLDMNSGMNLNRVDIVVYWKDHFGNLHPFQLQPGCSAHVKILFRRKDFNITN